MSERTEIEFVFEPEEGGGYRVYAPELPGLHTQGDDIKDATANAEEALALYVEGLPRGLPAARVRRHSPHGLNPGVSPKQPVVATRDPRRHSAIWG